MSSSGDRGRLRCRAEFYRSFDRNPDPFDDPVPLIPLDDHFNVGNDMIRVFTDKPSIGLLRPTLLRRDPSRRPIDCGDRY